MDWLKKHTDTVIVLSAILSSVFWMNSKFGEIEKELVVIKTVLIVKGIYPSELCSTQKTLNEDKH
jgi:hypothetical protein